MNTPVAVTVSLVAPSLAEPMIPSCWSDNAASVATVVNLSSFTVTVAGYSGADDLDRLPRLGTTATYGEPVDFAISPMPLRHSDVAVHIEITHPDGRVLAHGSCVRVGGGRISAHHHSLHAGQHMAVVQVMAELMVLRDVHPTSV